MELNPAFSFDFGGEADAHQAPWEFGGERLSGRPLPGQWQAVGLDSPRTFAVL